MVKARKSSAISMPRACTGVMPPKSSSNIPKHPHCSNCLPWLIAQILLVIKPAVSGKVRMAAIRGNTPRSKTAPRMTSIQGRTWEIKKATEGVQKEPRRTSTNSACPGSLPAPDTSSTSPSSMQGTKITSILCRLVFNCGFRKPIEISSPSAY